MAAQELDDKTLAALANQGGITNEPPKTDEPGNTDSKESTETPPMEFKPKESTKEVESQIPVEESTPSTPTVEEQMATAGITTEDLQKEITSNGEISAETIAKAKETIDPAVVDKAVADINAGIKTAEEAQTAADKAIEDMNTFIHDSVGGKEKFDALSAHLADNVTASELALLNAKIGSGNKALVEEGMKEAIKSYNNARGMGGKLMSGDAGSTPGEEALPRVTKEEFRTIIASDKYKTDKAYANKMDEARMATAKADKVAYGPGQYYGFTNGQRYEL